MPSHLAYCYCPHPEADNLQPESLTEPQVSGSRVAALQQIPFGAAANLTTWSAPQRAGRTGRFYPTDTGDPSKTSPSKTMGPQPCEQRWKCKPNRQDASGLQSCSDKSRGSLFLFQGNCTRDDLPRWACVGQSLVHADLSLLFGTEQTQILLMNGQRTLNFGTYREEAQKALCPELSAAASACGFDLSFSEHFPSW